MKVLRNRAFRWGLLMVGLLAIITLTGMNVLSLYDLRDRMVESEEERRIDQLDEINDSIRNQILAPLRGLYKLELEPIEASIQRTGHLPENIQEVLQRSSESPFFTGIYFTPEGIDPCEPGTEVYQYDPAQLQVVPVSEYPDILCDGVGITRTKTRIQLNDFNYRWNNNFEFDTHRSLNLGLINLAESRMIGVLTLTLDQDYITNEVLPPILKNYFGDSKETGIVVWVLDWPDNNVIASSDPDVEYDRDLRDYRIRFSGSGFFDNWSMNLAFLKSPVTSAYNDTLLKNLFVLGVAVLFLLGALIFMFVTAQRERHLAQRQASFLANVTHELKTPLAVMQAAGENISDGRVTEPKRLKQYGEHIYNESIRLRGMIEKLLDVARVDSGQNMIKAAPYEVKELLANYLSENREYIEKKGFKVSFKTTEDSTLSLIDSDSFETIVNNLTENALKYSTDEKFIEYQVSTAKDSVYFSITDHGIGIPKKDQKNIFKKFYRVEKSDTQSQKIKGHGLGLSIVQNLVELNEGTIDIKSSLGKGTTFIVRFPKLDHGETDVGADISSNSNSSSLNTKNKHTKYVG
ncbi:sensor histidine kinase [Gracilimonas tropica]|uniref:sensor histidine kinase n=1 Tax=Gracilimonas tropica TaxID=454600 RepID=UPI00036FC9E4|nr:HAMP domain-containing sensor histidine kinase [Gracilimonas tropica]